MTKTSSVSCGRERIVGSRGKVWPDACYQTYHGGAWQADGLFTPGSCIELNPDHIKNLHAEKGTCFFKPNRRDLLTSS
jgi:hypothetical protein